MTSPEIFGVAAALLQTCSYAIYLRRVFRGACTPNPMSWLMWTYGTAVLLFLQADTGAPISVMLAPAFCVACSVCVTARALAASGRLRPVPQDWLLLGVDVAILVAYLMAVRGPEPAGREAALAFLLLPAVSSAITSWPTLRSTFRDPRNERPASWFISAGSDLAVAAAVLAEGLEWQYLVYPVVTMLTQLAIGLLALGRREPRASAAENPAVPGAFS